MWMHDYSFRPSLYTYNYNAKMPIATDVFILFSQQPNNVRAFDLQKYKEKRKATHFRVCLVLELDK